jgi:bifunctional ADP-heptose synthase (sugar kinase/adenylyltransferase)
MINRIAVFGDACVDVFFYGKCDRLCPEAPVPVFVPQKTETNDGMALNVARNIRSLGAECLTVTNDPVLIKKQRYVESSINHMILRVDEEQVLHPLDLKDIPTSVWECDCVIVSDYNKGFLTENIMSEISHRFPLSFLDTKKPLGVWADSFSFIKINESEYEKTSHSVTPVLWNKLIVTLGKNGCMHQNKIHSSPSITNTANVCGAGDTFLAGLAVEYLNSRNVESAIRHALRCASNVVQKRGVSVPDSNV